LLITGGTGFLGSRLVELARARGDEVTITSRRAGEGRVAWDTRSPLELPPVDAIVHLVGEGIVDRRWSEAFKAEIERSRIESTRRLVDAIAGASTRPRVLVMGSAIGFYGNRGDEELTEDSSPGEGFLPELCQRWEAEAERAAELGVRVVELRTGVVLDPAGGALARMLTPFRLGLGGPLGNGQQWMSWITRDDHARLTLACVDDEKLVGPVNGTAPGPVTNLEFARTLGRVLGRPAFVPVPAFALWLLLGEGAQVLLEGQRVLPARAREVGFEFEHAELGAALTALLGR
jgi:uncharacterized protein (TIGR01777 family)